LRLALCAGAAVQPTLYPESGKARSALAQASIDLQILRVMRLWSEAHPYECNDWAIHNSLQKWELQWSEVLNFQEFLFDEENAVGLKALGVSQPAGL